VSSTVIPPSSLSDLGENHQCHICHVGQDAARWLGDHGCLHETACPSNRGRRHGHVAASTRCRCGHGHVLFRSRTWHHHHLADRGVLGVPMLELAGPWPGMRMGMLVPGGITGPCGQCGGQYAEDTILRNRTCTEQLCHPDKSEKGKAAGVGNKPTAKELGALRETVRPQPRYSVVHSSIKILTTPQPRNASGFTCCLILKHVKWEKNDLAHTRQAACGRLDHHPSLPLNLFTKHVCEARLVVPRKHIVKLCSLRHTRDPEKRE
jgi:hypothetical protein